MQCQPVLSPRLDIPLRLARRRARRARYHALRRQDFSRPRPGCPARPPTLHGDPRRPATRCGKPLGGVISAPNNRCWWRRGRRKVSAANAATPRILLLFTRRGARRLGAARLDAIRTDHGRPSREGRAPTGWLVIAWRKINMAR